MRIISIPIFLFVLMLLSVNGCAVNLSKEAFAVRYFEDNKSAPPYRQISIVECEGFVGLFKMPTFEEALKEAKIEAVEKGGDAVILLKAVKASESNAGKVDLTALASTILLDEKKSTALNDHMSNNMVEEQLVWFFIVAKLVAKN